METLKPQWNVLILSLSFTAVCFASGTIKADETKFSNEWAVAELVKRSESTAKQFEKIRLANRSQGQLKSLFWLDKEGQRKWLDKEIIGLMSTIGSGRLSELQKQAVQLLQSIENEKSKISEIEVESSLAPTTVSNLNPFCYILNCTKDQFEASLRKKKKSLSLTETVLTQVKGDLIREMRELPAFNGLSEEQLNLHATTLIYSPTGSQVAEIISAYQNLNGLVQFINDGIRNSTSELAQKKYFGAYTLLIRTLIAAHLDIVNEVKTKLIPKLDSQVEAMIQLQTDTLNIAAENTTQQDLNRASLAKQERSLQAAKPIREFLLSIQKRAEATANSLQAPYEAAEIAFLTSTLSLEMMDVLADSASFERALAQSLPNLSLAPTQESEDLLQLVREVMK